MVARPAFAQYLIDSIRSAPDEVVLELVVNYLQQMGGQPGAAMATFVTPASVMPSAELTQAVTKRTSRARVAREATRASDRRRTRTSRADRQAQIREVQRFVDERDTGVSRGEVAEALDLPPAVAAQALKTLAADGVLHRAGERRFTRYGRTKTIAEAASRDAQA